MRRVLENMLGVTGYEIIHARIHLAEKILFDTGQSLRNRLEIRPARSENFSSCELSLPQVGQNIFGPLLVCYE